MEEEEAIALARQAAPFVHPQPPYRGILSLLWTLLKTLFAAFFLLPMRLFVLCVALASYFVIAVVLQGLLPAPTAMPMLRWLGRRSLRAALLLLGVFRIKTSGHRDPKVSTLVSNHLSYVDVLVYGALFFPSFVAKGSIRDIPVIGYLAKHVFQCVFVENHLRDRPSTIATDTTATTSATKHVSGVAARRRHRQIHPPAEQKDARPARQRNKDEEEAAISGIQGIIARQEQQKDGQTGVPPLLIFPEGTTTNGRYLIHFHKGAFAGGYPIQPVFTRFPFRRWSPTWESIPFYLHLFQLLTQFYIPVEVTFLPAYYPSFDELADPQLYADNVQQYMAKKMGVPATEHTIHDKLQHHSRILAGIVSWRHDPLAAASPICK
ncbi:Lysophospholipid acyltransferase LPEAT2 [Balamuthia mandrillaris]